MVNRKKSIFDSLSRIYLNKTPKENIRQILKNPAYFESVYGYTRQQLIEREIKRYKKLNNKLKKIVNDLYGNGYGTWINYTKGQLIYIFNAMLDLIRKGANPNVKGVSNVTPFLISVYVLGILKDNKVSSDLLSELIRLKVDVNATDIYGNNAFNLTNNRHIKKILL